MVDTGSWSISDLISYLLEVQDTLTPNDFSMLEVLEAFTAEGAQGDMGEKRRYRALDLYPPLDTFRKLQLPVIDWGENWRNESGEGKQSTSL